MYIFNLFISSFIIYIIILYAKALVLNIYAIIISMNTKYKKHKGSDYKLNAVEYY